MRATVWPMLFIEGSVNLCRLYVFSKKRKRKERNASDVFISRN